MSYSGIDYPIADWNQNLSLRQAFHTSCIWYFRQVIDQVGREEVQLELEELSYGNCDCSAWQGSQINPLPDLNGFWLDASLRISPKEQVLALATIFEGHSRYDSQKIAILKDLMQTKHRIGRDSHPSVEQETKQAQEQKQDQNRSPR